MWSIYQGRTNVEDLLELGEKTLTVKQHSYVIGGVTKLPGVQKF